MKEAGWNKGKRNELEKQTTIFGCWNITSLTGKEAEVVEEMMKYRIPILGVSETKKKGYGTMLMHRNYTLRYSGVGKDSRAKEGVGILMSPEMNERVTNWEPINSRIIRVDIELEEKVSLIQIYAPTEDKGQIKSNEILFIKLIITLQRNIQRKISK
jgi:hypothetical protein